MIEVQERVRRMKQAFQSRVEGERQKDSKILGMRRKKPKGKLTFYDIEVVSGKEEVRE